MALNMNVLVCLLGIAVATAEVPEFELRQAGVSGQLLDCGDLYYDDGTAETAIFFGGGQAGSTDHFLGVRFELEDFDLQPGAVALIGFCVSNQLDFSGQGGPWPNEVFVYRDIDGQPDIDHPERQGTMWTGDGTGKFELDFAEPWLIDQPFFWIMVRGDPMHAGEDFNVETDLSSKPTGNSWLTDRGLNWMYQTGQNLMIRANVVDVPQGQPDMPVDPVPVPTLKPMGLALIVLAVLFAGRHRLSA